MTRKLLWPVPVIGIALVPMPLIFQMPTRAAAGERMMSDFQPIMQADQVQKDFQGLLGAMGANTDVFSQVPGGIAHYKPLVETMQGNVDDYESAASLPSFNLLSWFFIVPGLLLVLLAGWGLLADSKETRLTRAVTPRPTPSH